MGLGLIRRAAYGFLLSVVGSLGLIACGENDIRVDTNEETGRNNAGFPQDIFEVEFQAFDVREESEPQTVIVRLTRAITEEITLPVLVSDPQRLLVSQHTITFAPDNAGQEQSFVLTPQATNHLITDSTVKVMVGPAYDASGAWVADFGDVLIYDIEVSDNDCLLFSDILPHDVSKTIYPKNALPYNSCLEDSVLVRCDDGQLFENETPLDAGFESDYVEEKSECVDGTGLYWGFVENFFYEGDSADVAYFVLNKKPQGDVVISLSSNNPALVLDKDSVTLTQSDWYIPHIVHGYAPLDGDALDTEGVTIDAYVSSTEDEAFIGWEATSDLIHVEDLDCSINNVYVRDFESITVYDQRVGSDEDDSCSKTQRVLTCENGGFTIDVGNVNNIVFDVNECVRENYVMFSWSDPHTVDEWGGRHLFQDGEVQTIDVWLNHRPSSEVSFSVSLNTNNAFDLNVQGGNTIYFNPENWNQPQRITVSVNSGWDGSYEGDLLDFSPVSTYDAGFSSSPVHDTAFFYAWDNDCDVWQYDFGLGENMYGFAWGNGHRDSPYAICDVDHVNAMRDIFSKSVVVADQSFTDLMNRALFNRDAPGVDIILGDTDEADVDVDEFRRDYDFSLSGIKNHSFALMRNISLETCDQEYYDEGEEYYYRGWEPISGNMGVFYGEFDGRDHVISGLCQTSNDNITFNYGGLFGMIAMANIHDLVITDAEITDWDFFGSEYEEDLAYDNSGLGDIFEIGVGVGVLGSSLFFSKVEDVHVSGLVDMPYQSGIDYNWGFTQGVGGLVGNSKFSAIDSASSDVNVQGGAKAGGLVGLSKKSRVDYSRTSNDVAGDLRVGGLVGMSKMSHVHNSSSSSDISGTGFMGGLVGYMKSAWDEDNSYCGVSLFGAYDSSLGCDVDESSAQGDVTGSGTMGGLIGLSKKTPVADTHATGLVRWNQSSVQLNPDCFEYDLSYTEKMECYANSDVSYEGFIPWSRPVNGLGVLQPCYFDSEFGNNVSCSAYDNEYNNDLIQLFFGYEIDAGACGGLIGMSMFGSYLDTNNSSDVLVDRSYATGHVLCPLRSGGLVGVLHADSLDTVYDEYDGNSLVGYSVDPMTVVRESWAGGNVRAAHGERVTPRNNMSVGGLIGAITVDETDTSYFSNGEGSYTAYATMHLQDVYSTGHVVGGYFNWQLPVGGVGGIVGSVGHLSEYDWFYGYNDEFSFRVINSYASGGVEPVNTYDYVEECDNGEYWTPELPVGGIVGVYDWYGSYDGDTNHFDCIDSYYYNPDESIAYGCYYNFYIEEYWINNEVGWYDVCNYYTDEDSYGISSLADMDDMGLYYGTNSGSWSEWDISSYWGEDTWYLEEDNGQLPLLPQAGAEDDSDVD